MQHIEPLLIRLHTTADVGRPAFPPRLEVWDPTVPIPWQTGMLEWGTSALSSFFGGQRVYTATEIEGIRKSALS